MQGVVCIIPIAPYYGVRKPKAQTKWFLREVSDAFLQAVGVAVEAACLLHWAKKTWGADVPLSTAGLSFGGAMAALAAKMYNGPLAVIPYMGCIGPGEPFSEGAFPVVLHCLNMGRLSSDCAVQIHVLACIIRAVSTCQGYEYCSCCTVRFCASVYSTRDVQEF